MENLRKQQFTVKKMSGDEVVEGYAGKHLGTYENIDRFPLIHLKTGLSLSNFWDLTVAIETLERIENEKFLISWDDPDIKKFTFNRWKVERIKAQVEKQYYGTSLIN